jgi:ferredoxin
MGKRGLWSSPVKPSTKAFWQEGQRTPGYSCFDWLHGYVYARWPYLYISIGVGEHPLARRLGPLAGRVLDFFETRQRSPKNRITFADTYHGKVMPVAEARRLVTINRDISLTNLEQVIPYARARDIVLHNPDHIIVLECPCRASRPNPCQPLDVCLIIGEPFAGLIAEHHPRRSRWITPDEAVNILQAEHERGHVQHAFFKDAMLGRFYAICNCCGCCCGAMQAWRNGVPMLASSGYVSQADPGRCCGCGACAEACQFGAITMQDGRAMVNAGRCMGCGVCASKCPYEAIALRREPGRGEPLEIQALLDRG